MTLLEDLKREREELAAKAGLFDRLAELFGWSPEELADRLRSGKLRKALEGMALRSRERRRIYAAFPCVVCGKPIEWGSAEGFIKAVKGAIRKGRWTWRHKGCGEG